ncbi:hypothetical protein LVD15_24765 [Fulvivirga maritima]|uniref:hypothetical protein n=1 Tax=Fulvivirga maritima TaxID=2904247 RepID=UPI001F23E3D9|nr:hypothetical protein [Fulvivirga maritima]UII26470.1 hypothetical protein LVD15_24765 [Fulvivirga maritima]
MEILVIILYVIISIAILFGVMFFIRRKRDKDSGRSTSHKVDDIKAEEKTGR